MANWVKFVRTPNRYGLPPAARVSGGKILLNVGAVLLLDKPAVILYFDPETREIALECCESKSPDSWSCGKGRNERPSGTIGAKRFIEHCGFEDGQQFMIRKDGGMVILTPCYR